MPNHVINEIIFDRHANEHEAILDAACGFDGNVDFNRLVPMPANVWRGSSGSEHTNAFGKDCIGLDWARANWGTKWNAYDHRPIEATDGKLVLRFETAWSPPYPWLVALFNTVGGFLYNWLDEGREAALTGRFSKDGPFGDEWKEGKADEALQRHLHKLLWGVEEFVEEPDENIQALAARGPSND